MSEYISVPWKQVVPLPQSISLLTAAASLLQGLTALTFVTEAHNVQKGETVLIHTVAGGLGAGLISTLSGTYRITQYYRSHLRATM